MLKDLILQIALGFQRNVARGFQLGEHAVVIRRIDDDDHICAFLAAARSMVGPPISMFSIASSKVTPGFSMVARKGYRL